MNSKLERFDALDKVIINLETEAQKLGAFSGLVAQVDSANKDFTSLINRQENCHRELQALVSSSGEPVQKLQTLTKKLEIELEQVSHKQLELNDSLQKKQTEQFNVLLDRQSSITESIGQRVEDLGEKIKSTCHEDLERIIKSTEPSLQSITALTERLQVEIAELNTRQSDFYDQQVSSQGDYFREFLREQETVSEMLQDGVQAIALEVKKIDPGLPEEIREAYQETRSELTKIQGQLTQITEVLHTQKIQIHDLQGLLTDHENSINQRFTKLDLAAEKIRHIPNALEQLQIWLQESAEETRQYRETEQKRQNELANTLHTLSKFTGFSKIAFGILSGLVVVSFFVGA